MLISDGPATHTIGVLVTALGSGASFRYISLAVRNMPIPLATDTRWYKWLYNFLQDAFANPDRKVQ